MGGVWLLDVWVLQRLYGFKDLRFPLVVGLWTEKNEFISFAVPLVVSLHVLLFIGDPG